MGAADDRRRRHARACVSRSGYTGEDGFEISVAGRRAEALAQPLLDEPEVAPAGLGARDSLRLEAGLASTATTSTRLTTPVEAGLAWAIGKRRRTRAGTSRAPPRSATSSRHGPRGERVGIRPDGRAPARAGTEIVAGDGTEAGARHLAAASRPTLNAPIAMGYVRKDLAGRRHARST